jgi:hypothetical protein
MEVLPQILLDFKDTELTDLLLFSLPWLCHGKPPQEQGSVCEISPSGSPVKGPDAVKQSEKCLEVS